MEKELTKEELMTGGLEMNGCKDWVHRKLTTENWVGGEIKRLMEGRTDVESEWKEGMASLRWTEGMTSLGGRKG